MKEHTCIYCKKTKQVADFDKDHVVPKSFGRFKNNLTLLNAVCKDCNHYFSKELELALARDSLWGLMRFRYGIKAFVKSKWIHGSRVRMSLDDPTLGDWNGALVELIPPRNTSDSDPEIIFIPQAAFTKAAKGKWIRFRIDELPSRAELIKEGFDLTRCKLFGNSQADIEKCKQALIRLAIDIGQLKELIDDRLPAKRQSKWRVCIESKVDSVIFRAMARIAFNYLAMVQGTIFVLSTQFDEIRGFIRNGKNKEKRLVTMAASPLLKSKAHAEQIMREHALVLRWGDLTFSHIIGQVSLFNYFTFNVLLCRRFSGIIRQIDSAHIYDLAKDEVIKLERSSLII